MSLVFQTEFEPRHGVAIEVAPGVRRVTARNVGPYTFLGTNSYVIGKGEVAVLDPGPADEAHLEALLRAIGSARVAMILVTHSHHDHVDAAGPLQSRTGAPILAADPADQAAPRPVSGISPERGDRLFAPDGVLADRAVVSLGGMSLEVIATPGHAADHLCFALLGHDLLFSGDHVMGWSTSLVAPPDGSMTDYMRSLETLLARPERLFLPGHGGSIADPHAYMRGLRTHRRMREKGILERVAAGDRLIPTMVASIYRNLDQRLHSAACLSTLAHLEDLTARGLVATEQGANLDATYWPAAAPVSGADSGGGVGNAAGLPLEPEAAGAEATGAGGGAPLGSG